ncbi:hypothetical protein [Sporosarcina sp. G11-34]|uniref:hypothetical protein n=1 Tax=Sporosarcina sp. G11-34 TaxID=2849605 RepID=UPI0022A9A7E9|nr:hypothetical protein [Sporosarcina sp. G11-34]MCZ2260489.1 hypothetical protein [Sporosarcina sp. G11-34]
MSKWTLYQMLIVFGFTALVVVNNIYTLQITKLFSFVERFIETSIIVFFITVIIVTWGFSFLLLCQEKKGSRLFVHKIWRIMPAIIGLLLVVSFIALLILGTTVLSDLSLDRRWILDIIVIYFLILIYFFILSIILRYGKKDTSKEHITKSANLTVLTLIVVVLLIPALL